MKHTHHTHHSKHSEYSHHSNYEYTPGSPAENAHQLDADAQALHETVAAKAFEIYQKEGCPEGRELQHWLEAETEISA